MKEMLSITTKTYYVGDNFYVEITTNALSEYYEAWIWCESYGIKEHIFSAPMTQQTYDEFLNLIENTIDEDIKFYVADHFDYLDKEEFYAKNNILQSN